MDEITDVWIGYVDAKDLNATSKGASFTNALYCRMNFYYKILTI